MRNSAKISEYIFCVVSGRCCELGVMNATCTLLANRSLGACGESNDAVHQVPCKIDLMQGSTRMTDPNVIGTWTA